MFILLLLLLFYCWLLVSASKDYHQVNTYKNLKMLVHNFKKRQIHRNPFAFISVIYNYYQLLDVLSVVICVKIL